MKAFFATFAVVLSVVPAQALMFSKYTCDYFRDENGWRPLSKGFSSYSNELGQNEVAGGVQGLITDEKGSGLLAICSSVNTWSPDNVFMTIRFFKGTDMQMETQNCVFYGNEMTLERTDKVVLGANDYVAARTVYEVAGKQMEFLEVLGLAPSPLADWHAVGENCDRAFEETTKQKAPSLMAPLKAPPFRYLQN